MMNTFSAFFLFIIASGICLASHRTYHHSNDEFDGRANHDDDSDERNEERRATSDNEYWMQRGRSMLKHTHRMKKLILDGYQQWQIYKNEHNKVYEDEETENRHMLAFLSNVEAMHKHNELFKRGKSTFEMDVNHISDLPFEEYRKLNGFRRTFGDATRNATAIFMKPFNTNVPDHWDWRDHGYVTEVKNQGMCGSCWAFSSTGALEGQHKRKFDTLVSLSEQNLVDCSRKYGNNGCNGGLMDNAFTYIKENHGIDTEVSYPYKGRDMKCHFNRKTVGADDNGFFDLPEGDEDALKTAVATQGPISVAIDAGHTSFQMYKKGIYYEPQCSPEMLDHGVLVVGYGTDENDGDYWIIKNSWGIMWGEKGYMRMARNRKNHCGVASKASFPIV